MLHPCCWALRLLAVVALGLVGCDAASPVGADAGATNDAVSADGFDAKAQVYAPGTATGATARYELSAKDWHALPFPSDLRRSSDGTLDLLGFPPARDGTIAPLLSGYLGFAQGELRGFSVQPTVYVQFDQAMDAKRLVNPLESNTLASPYLLVNVDAASPEYGQLMAVRGAVSGTQRGQYLMPNLLMLQPVWGQPLRPVTTYALVVKRSLKDNIGKVLGQPQALADVVAHWATGTTLQDPAVAKLAATLEPLHQAIVAGKVPVPYQDLAAVTVFTTGNPTGQLRGMADWVRTSWKPDPATEWKIAKKTKTYWLLEANYQSPNFQVGKCPYDGEGSGGFQFDAQGNPKVDHLENLRVSVLLPVERPHDVGGNSPVVMSAHGTGGDWMSYVNGGTFKISDQLAAQSLPIVSIDQPMHGPRCDPPLDDNKLDSKTFNFINIAAGRSGFRQSALDSVAMTKMLRMGLLNVPPEFSPDGNAVHFDPLRISFIGHSQGGLSGALLAAVEPDVAAYVLSGAGAGISLTVVQRKNPVDFAALVSGLLVMDDGELSEFHPAISVVQSLADATDPLSYGEWMFARAKGIRPPNLLLTEGLLDAATPADTSEALAAAIGLDVLSPKVRLNDAMKVKGTLELASPAQDNLKRNGFAITGVVSQWAKLDHFAIFTSSKVAELYTGFLTSTALTGVGVALLP